MKYISSQINLVPILDIGINLEENKKGSFEDCLSILVKAKRFIFEYSIIKDQTIKEFIYSTNEDGLLNIDYQIWFVYNEKSLVEDEKVKVASLELTYFNKNLWINTHLGKLDVSTVSDCDKHILGFVNSFHQEVLDFNLGEKSTFFQEYGARRFILEERLDKVNKEILNHIDWIVKLSQ